MQTLGESALESILNVVSGFIIALLVWWLIVTPLLGIAYSMTQSIFVALIFQFASFLRMLFWRRIFNWIEKRRHDRETEL